MHGDGFVVADIITRDQGHQVAYGSGETIEVVPSTGLLRDAGGELGRMLGASEDRRVEMRRPLPRTMLIALVAIHEPRWLWVDE